MLDSLQGNQRKVNLYFFHILVLQLHFYMTMLKPVASLTIYGWIQGGWRGSSTRALHGTFGSSTCFWTYPKYNSHFLYRRGQQLGNKYIGKNLAGTPFLSFSLKSSKRRIIPWADVLLPKHPTNGVLNVHVLFHAIRKLWMHCWKVCIAWVVL